MLARNVRGGHFAFPFLEFPQIDIALSYNRTIAASGIHGLAVVFRWLFNGEPLANTPGMLPPSVVCPRGQGPALRFSPETRCRQDAQAGLVSPLG